MPEGSDFFWEVLLHDYKILNYFGKYFSIKIPDSYSAVSCGSSQGAGQDLETHLDTNMHGSWWEGGARTEQVEMSSHDNLPWYFVLTTNILFNKLEVQ